MRNFDEDFAAEIVKETLSSFILVEFQLASGTYRYTDADHKVYWGSNMFLPKGMEFDTLSSSSSLSVDRTAFTMDNAALDMSALLLGEDVRNRPVILYAGMRLSEAGAGRLPGAVTGYVAEEIFRGLLEQWEIKEKTVKVSITNELILWSKKTIRKQSSSCPWTFKGTECAYAGSEAACNRTYERCVALSNNLNFGGDRFLPSIVQKQIWWGRTQGATS